MFVATMAALGVSLSILAFSVILGFERGRHQQDFEFKAANLMAALQAEIDSHVTVLHSLHFLYSASESVTRREFGGFARNQLMAHPAHPGIQALEWIPKVTKDERDSFEAAMQAEGFTDFAITERRADGALAPAAERLEYFPVTYVEPYSRNDTALGFDLASNPSRYAALREARDSGEPVATQRIVLVQETENQYGFLVFIPVYQKGFPTSTIAQRNDALDGFVLGVFRVDDLVSSAWRNAGLPPSTADNTLILLDRSAPEGFQALLLSPEGLDVGAIHSGPLAYTDSLSVGGRIWEATIIAPQPSVLTIWQPWSALLAGLSLTIIVLAYLLLAMQRESKTRLLVEQRTQELSKANQQLEEEVIDRSRAQRKLAGLYEISRILSAMGDFEAKAAEALEKMADLAAADWVTLRLPKEGEPGLHLVAASGPAVTEYAPIPVFTEAMAISTLAFAEGRIVVIDDYAAQPAPSQTLLDLGMQSMVILPVKAGERTVGLVTVISKDKDHFSLELVDLLAAIGEGLGVLLDNSMLHEETQRAHQAQRQLAEENAVMAEIGRIVNSSLDIDEVYQRIGSQVGKLVDFDRLTINLIDRENGTATSTFITGIYIPEIPTGRVFQLSGSSSGLAASTKVTQLILPQSEQELADLFPPMVAAYQAGIKSFMLVPLLSQGEVVAVMRIQSFEANAYNENDARVAELVGAQIAGAIANASLYLRQVVADAEIKDLAKFPSEDPNPVARISAGGIVIYANDAASKLLTGRDLEAGDSTLESWRELAEEALANDTPKEAEIDYGTRIISYSLVPVPDAGYVNIYGRDITAAKEVERLKDEFISTVSHELRTPLTSIKGAAEILLNYPDEDPATQAEFLGIIDSESDRLTRLINDVLDLARLDSGQMRWHMSQADLVSVIETAVDSTHALTVQKNVTVKIGSADGLPPFESDTDKLVQVLTNLLSNAIKFTPSGGLICVRTRLLPNLDPKTGVKMAEVSVSDNGVGIPATELDNIFNRFQQVGTTLSDRPQGTGLGLAISKEIVAHLGGEIWVESQLGKGSTFFFTIPVAQTSN